MLIAMTILGTLLALIFAPMLHELRSAAEVNRQTDELMKLGYGVYWQERPEKTFGLWLARNFWPVRVKNLGRHIPIIQGHPGRNYDLLAVPQFSSINELRFGYGTVRCSDPDFQMSQVVRVVYEYCNQFNPPLDPDIHLLTHFPNVEEVRVWNVPADNRVLQDLRSCQKLRGLELCLDGRWITADGKSRQQPLNIEPLCGLAQLQELKIVKLPESTDWSFLADMTELQLAEINPTSMSSLDDVLNSKHDRVPPREETPLRYLAKLPQLRSLKLQSTPAYAEDIESLAKHTAIEDLQLDHVPEGPTALAGLRHAKSLRRLHLKMSQFDDLLALRHELQQLTQLRELNCVFREFTFDHAQLLASLQQLKTLRIPHYSSYTAGPAGRVVLSEAPLMEFHGYIIGMAAPGTFANDIRKLVQLADENRRQRELVK